MNGLLGSTILEVAVGAIFVYLLLAVFCTTVNEWLASMLQARAGTLKQAISELLNDQSVGEGKAFLSAFYDHPVITSMMKKCAHPSYLPSRTFSTAVMDLATSGVKGTITFADLETGIKKLPDGDVKTALLALIQNAHGDLTRAQANIETWFNDAMDRASEWYRKRMQVWTIVIAAVLTIATNADTFNMLRHFWVDPTIRSTIVAQAGQAQAAQAVDSAGITQLGLVFGWHAGSVPQTPGDWILRLVGWSLTIVAVSMGAPFWFDLLNRFMNFRTAGKPAENTVQPPPSAPPPAAGQAGT